MILKSTFDTVLKKNFLLVDENLSALGFTTNHKQAIYMILSAILNLGNIQFNALANDESSYIEIDSRTFLCNAAALLKVEELELEGVMISRTREIGKHQIK